MLTKDALSDGGDSEDDHPLYSLTSIQSIDGSQLGEKRSQQEEEVSRKRMKHKDTMDDAIFTKKIGKLHVCQLYQMITHAISTSLAHAHRGTIIMFIPVLSSLLELLSLEIVYVYMHACRKY